LPPAQDKALSNAFGDLQNLQPSQKCVQNVFARIPNLSVASLKSYLAKGATFFDGTKAARSAASLHPTLAGASFQRQNPTVSSIASWFGQRPGMNAVTSTVDPTLTVYVRPSVVDLSNQGRNARNQGLLFHEALHGYGLGRSDFNDQGLSQALGVAGPSAGISRYLSANCK
jgi:hypothetical protein